MEKNQFINLWYLKILTFFVYYKFKHYYGKLIEWQKKSLLLILTNVSLDSIGIVLLFKVGLIKIHGFQKLKNFLPLPLEFWWEANLTKLVFYIFFGLLNKTKILKIYSEWSYF